MEDIHTDVRVSRVKHQCRVHLSSLLSCSHLFSVTLCPSLALCLFVCCCCCFCLFVCLFLHVYRQLLTKLTQQTNTTLFLFLQVFMHWEILAEPWLIQA